MRSGGRSSREETGGALVLRELELARRRSMDARKRERRDVVVMCFGWRSCCGSGAQWASKRDEQTSVEALAATVERSRSSDFAGVGVASAVANGRWCLPVKGG